MDIPVCVVYLGALPVCSEGEEMVINHIHIYIVGSYLMKNKIVLSTYRPNIRVSVCTCGYMIALNIQRQRSVGIQQAMNRLST